MCETYTREEVILDNKHFPDNGEPGMYVRLVYNKKCRDWSLASGDALKRMPDGWGAEAFLHYDDSEQSNWTWVAEQLVEGVIQVSLEEY